MNPRRRSKARSSDTFSVVINRNTQVLYFCSILKRTFQYIVNHDYSNDLWESTQNYDFFMVLIALLLSNAAFEIELFMKMSWASGLSFL